jgi:hypothetical protein
MAKNFEKLIFGGLHEKHTVQRGIIENSTQFYICPYLTGNTLRLR